MKGVKSIFVASDNYHMLSELSDAFKQVSRLYNSHYAYILRIYI